MKIEYWMVPPNVMLTALGEQRHDKYIAPRRTTLGEQVSSLRFNQSTCKETLEYMHGLHRSERNIMRAVAIFGLTSGLMHWIPITFGASVMGACCGR